MDSPLIHDRGRGPELIGTRMTIYNLLPDFLDPTATERYLCDMYQLTPEQVAAARAYVLHHADTVLAEHLRIEGRAAAGNPPEVIEQARQTGKVLLDFKKWLAQRGQDSRESSGGNEPGRLPTFREWVAERERDRTGTPG